MAVHHVRREIDLQREREEDDRRFTSSLAALAFSLFLIWIGLYVIDRLAAQSKLEDCVLQGRADCVRVDLTSQR
jgi:putative methionine-R-sulfoxide reductase with GAF domain